MKIVMWDYKDTELPLNIADRSLHMKEMGGEGWELVSVSPNPEKRCHVFFWKRPQSLDIKNGKDSLQPRVNNLKDQNLQLEARRVNTNDPISATTYKSNRKISDHEYKKFPDPQVVMIVKYRPKKDVLISSELNFTLENTQMLLHVTWGSIKKTNLFV